MTDLLARLEKDGLLADEKLNATYVPVDSESVTIHIKSGKSVVEMTSWHELAEADGGTVSQSTSREIPRLAGLRGAPRDYVFFRMVWAETRARLIELIPAEGTRSEGRLVLEPDRMLSWEEPATLKGPGNPRGK